MFPNKNAQGFWFGGGDWVVLVHTAEYITTKHRPISFIKKQHDILPQEDNDSCCCFL